MYLLVILRDCQVSFHGQALFWRDVNGDPYNLEEILPFLRGEHLHFGLQLSPCIVHAQGTPDVHELITPPMKGLAASLSGRDSCRWYMNRCERKQYREKVRALHNFLYSVSVLLVPPLECRVCWLSLLLSFS